LSEENKVESENMAFKQPAKVSSGSDAIIIKILLGASLKHFITSSKDEHQEFKQKLQYYIEGIVGDLALPFEVILDISAAKDTDEMLDTPYIIYINNQRIYFQIDNPHKAKIEGAVLAIDIARGVLANRDYLLTEFLVGIIHKIWSKIHGEILSLYPKQQFREALEFCIRHGISLNRLMEEISKYQETTTPIPPFYHEKAFSLDSISVEILLNDEMYKKFEEPEEEIESEDDNQAKIPDEKTQNLDDKIPMVIDGLFYELGLFLPKPELSLDFRLREHECRFKINDLRFLPINMIGDEEYLVNDTAKRLEIIGIISRTTINPANKSEQAIVKGVESAKFCEKAGLTTWDVTGYLILALSGLIRSNASMFLSVETTNILFNKFKQAFPSLIKSVERDFTLPEITNILRALLDDELSIRDLRGLLEELVTLRKMKEHFKEDSKKFILDAVKKLRISQKEYLCSKYGGDRKTIICYLLNSKLEKILGDTEIIDPTTQLEILKQLVEKIKVPTMAGAKATVITKCDIRQKFRSVIARVLPKMAVLAYEELSPDLNIQPIDRINL